MWWHSLSGTEKRIRHHNQLGRVPGRQDQSDISGPNNAIEHINSANREIYVCMPTDAENRLDKT